MRRLRAEQEGLEMPTVDELYKYLNEKFPEELRCDWDNDGLMVADDPEREVYRVLCTLDVTEECVDYAVENRFDVIVSHHPMIFNRLGGVNYLDPISKKAIRLIKNGISVMSFHTRLDAAQGGVNDLFAKLLGLTNVTVLDGECDSIVRIGELAEPTDAKDFAAFIKKTLNAERVLYSLGGGEVKRVAVCGGDGKDFVRAVKCAGADSYVTGQLSYDIMKESNYFGLNMFEAGHFFTEDFVSAYLTHLILGRFTQVQTEYFSSNRIMAV